MPAAIGAAFALAYVSGYVVQAGYLAKFGVRDYDIAKASYLISGGAYCASLAILGFFIGVPLMMRKRIAERFRTDLQSAGMRVGARPFADLLSLAAAAEGLTVNANASTRVITIQRLASDARIMLALRRIIACTPQAGRRWGE
jgi:hypothetical protein